jgi:hypothetical protein
MDAALATVTLISLTTAFAMGIVTWRLTREERRRADARVATLMAKLDAAPLTVGAVDIDATQDRHHGPPERPHGRSVGAVGRTVPRCQDTPSAPVEQSPTRLVDWITSSPVALRPILATVTAAMAVSVTMLSQRYGAPPRGPRRRQSQTDRATLAGARQAGRLSRDHRVDSEPFQWDRARATECRGNRVQPGRHGSGNQTDTAAGRGAAAGERGPVHRLTARRRPDQPLSHQLHAGGTSVPHIDRRRPIDQARSAVPATRRGH